VPGEVGVITTNIRAMPGEQALLASILHGLPLLENAACRERHQVFDSAAVTKDRADVENAVAVCAPCPERSRCAQWVETLDSGSRRRLAVAGGMVLVKVREPGRAQTAVATGQRTQGRTETRSEGRSARGRRGSAQRDYPRRAARLARSRAREMAS
jgi:hypothetical protein